MEELISIDVLAVCISSTRKASKTAINSVLIASFHAHATGMQHTLKMPASRNRIKTKGLCSITGALETLFGQGAYSMT
jgi:hypothetical protein